MFGRWQYAYTLVVDTRIDPNIGYTLTRQYFILLLSVFGIWIYSITIK